MFSSQTPRYGAPGDKVDLIQPQDTPKQFRDKTSWRNGRIEQTMMMYDVEMEQTTCSNGDVIDSALVQFAITSDLTTKDKISLRHLPKNCCMNLDDGEDPEHLGGPFNWVMVPKSCSMVNHDSITVCGRQWSYLQGDVVKEKKAGKSTRLCQTPKCRSFSYLMLT